MTSAAGVPFLDHFEGLHGIRAAHRLRGDRGQSMQRIGNTTLTLDGRLAVWRF